MKKILLINGANLNRIGARDPALYGGKGLDYIVDKVKEYGKSLDIQVDDFQSNHEGVIVDKIQEAEGVYDGIIINPGPFTQYSHAIRVTLWRCTWSTSSRPASPPSPVRTAPA